PPTPPPRRHGPGSWTSSTTWRGDSDLLPRPKAEAYRPHGRASRFIAAAPKRPGTAHLDRRADTARPAAGSALGGVCDAEGMPTRPSKVRGTVIGPVRRARTRIRPGIRLSVECPSSPTTADRSSIETVTA